MIAIEKADKNQVLVVGAGPTGLTAAIELARRNIGVTIVDRRASGSSLSRAVGITPASLELLKQSGVTERLVAEGHSMRAVQIFLGETPRLHLPLTGLDPEFDFVLALPQDRTEAIMRDRLAELGITVAFGVEMTGLERIDGGVSATFDDGRQETFATVLGADGIHSVTRKSTKIPYEGIDVPGIWSIADVEADNGPFAHIFTVCLIGGGGVVVIAPLAVGRYRLVSNTEDALKTMPLDIGVTRIRRQGTFTISVRQARVYCRGAIYLAGDAAHCHSPVGGRGMNLGIADAAEFAHRLANRTLDGYSGARHAEGRNTIALSERGRKLVTMSGRGGDLLRTAALLAVDRIPTLKRKVANTVLHG